MRRGINLDLALCCSCFHVNFLAEEQRLVRSLKRVDTFGGSVAHLENFRSKTFGWRNPSAILPSVSLLRLPWPGQRSSADEGGRGPDGKALSLGLPAILTSPFKMH